MGGSTRDAILALRKDKQGVDVFETAEAEDGGSTAGAASTSTTQTYQHLLAQSKLGGDKKRSEDVVQLDLKPALAFARFAGKIYDSRPETASPTLPASAASRLAPLPFSRVDAAAASISSFSTLASSLSLSLRGARGQIQPAEAGDHAVPVRPSRHPQEQTARERERTWASWPLCCCASWQRWTTSCQASQETSASCG